MLHDFAILDVWEATTAKRMKIVR